MTVLLMSYSDIEKRMGYQGYNFSNGHQVTAHELTGDDHPLKIQGWHFKNTCELLFYLQIPLKIHISGPYIERCVFYD